MDCANVRRLAKFHHCGSDGFCAVVTNANLFQTFDGLLVTIVESIFNFLPKILIVLGKMIDQ